MTERLIEISEIWNIFKKKWWIIVVVTMTTTLLGIYKVHDLKPTYMATSKVFIGRGSEMLQLYSVEELEYYSEFVSVFSEISKIDGFFDKALKDNNIENNSISVASKLTFNSVSTSIPLYNIQYSSWNEEGMVKTLNVVTEELINKIKEMMPDTNPTILNEAVVYPIYPDKTRLPMIAFVVGIVLSIGIILVLDYLDDRITSKKQLDKILEIPILGEIPKEEKIATKKAKKEDNNVHSRKQSKFASIRSL